MADKIVKAVKKTAKKPKRACKKPKRKSRRQKSDGFQSQFKQTRIARHHSAFAESGILYRFAFVIRSQFSVHVTRTRHGKCGYVVDKRLFRPVQNRDIQRDKTRKSARSTRYARQKIRNDKKGKGIAFTVQFSSVIGVATYGFLSNNKTIRENKQ